MAPPRLGISYMARIPNTKQILQIIIKKSLDLHATIMSGMWYRDEENGCHWGGALLHGPCLLNGTRHVLFFSITASIPMLN